MTLSVMHSEEFHALKERYGCKCLWSSWSDVRTRTDWVQHGKNPEHRKGFTHRALVEARDDWTLWMEWIESVLAYAHPNEHAHTT